MNIDLNLPTSEPAPQYLTLDSWKKGVITLIDQSRLPKDALKEADNIFLYEDGTPGPRPGVAYFGSVSPNAAAWDGLDYYLASDESVHLVGVAGGTVYRSTNDGTTWTACTGGTLTSGVNVYFEQNESYLYMTNGTDTIYRYDGTTILQAYTNLSTPAAPSVAETGLTGTANNYYYKVARVNNIGMSIASPATAAVQANLSRENWDTTTNYATLTLPAYVSDQTRTDVYVSTDNTTFYYLGSSSTTTFIDDGSWVVNPIVTAPTANSTQGPRVEELVNVGSRMYGIRDADNKYRIWFTSGTPPYGAFSTAYGGGYLDWQEGGKYIPVKVEDYRDGKGTPYASVWCKSSDGQGCVLQMSLDDFTVGDITITVPSAYKLPGSRGTPAPGSVVNVLNDYHFYNSQAFYNLGSRAQFLNLLSTDEISSNIRPSVKQISTEGEENICSVYYDAKVYYSVPVGQTTNNRTMVYDTERRAWLPTAFTIGFKKFLKYTDTTMTQRLLALTPGSNRISEISSSIQGDYGVAFNTSLVTGLYSTSKNRFEFQWTREGELEFSNPQGTIYVELLGIQRTRGFTATSQETITTTLTDTGWDTFGWDTNVWDDTSDVPDTFSESSIKRYFRVQKELNAVQWRITTSSLDARYVLRTLQTGGTVTNAGKPKSWRI